jgi:hypothetical protein
MKMRELGENDELCGEDLVNREHFDLLSRAIEDMSTKENGSMKHGLRVSLGYLLKKLPKVLKGHYITKKEMEKAIINSFILSFFFFYLVS